MVDIEQHPYQAYIEAKRECNKVMMDYYQRLRNLGVVAAIANVRSSSGISSQLDWFTGRIIFCDKHPLLGEVIAIWTAQDILMRVKVTDFIDLREDEVLFRYESLPQQNL